MNKMIRKSILLILIATILIAPSMSLMQVHACGWKTPIPSGPIYFYPSIAGVADYFSSPDPPSSGGEEGPTVQVASVAISTGFQEYPLPNIMGDYWNVFYTSASVISGRVEVFVQYDPKGLSLCQQRHLSLYIWDPVDFNLDGTVNLQDVGLVLQAIQQQHKGFYDPTYDVNHDGVVNCADLGIVLQFLCHGLIVNQGGHLARLPWMDITFGVDTVNHYVYGFTDHFSVFGVR